MKIQIIIDNAICINFCYNFCSLWDSFNWLPSMKIHYYANLHKVVNLILHPQERHLSIKEWEIASMESLILHSGVCGSQYATEKTKKKKNCHLVDSCKVAFEFEKKSDQKTVNITLSVAWIKFIYNGNQDGEIWNGSRNPPCICMFMQAYETSDTIWKIFVDKNHFLVFMITKMS